MGGILAEKGAAFKVEALFDGFAHGEALSGKRAGPGDG
jgi:hypothetical protein